MFTCRNFSPCDHHVGKEKNEGWRQKRKCNLDPSALFTNVNKYGGRQTKLSTFIAVITHGTTHSHFYLVYTWY